ncbi:hypothetical protein HDU76_012026, partial [Blyttiomyces sp. JEL0837]
ALKSIEDLFFILDLLAIYAYDKLEEHNNYDKSKMSLLVAFQNVLKLLSNWKTLRIFWTENYPRTSIPSFFLASSSPALILDPCNPLRNLVNPAETDAWNELSILAMTSNEHINEAKTKNILQQSTFVSHLFTLSSVESFAAQYVSYKFDLVSAKDPFPHTIPVVEFDNIENIPSSQIKLLQQIGHVICSHIQISCFGLPIPDKNNLSVAKSGIETMCRNVLSSFVGNVPKPPAAVEGITCRMLYPIQLRFAAIITLFVVM